jgi:MOSC domain-containing protein YiiM
VGGEFGRVSQKRHPGWSRVYARVLAEGRLRPDDGVRIVSRLEAGERGAIGTP